MMRSRLSVVALAVCSFLPSALVAEVKRVTLFPDQATIEREEAVSLDAGEGRLTISNLSPGLQESAFRVGLTGAGEALIRSVDVRQVSRSEAWEARHRELQTELQSLKDQRQALSDRIQVARYRVDLVESTIAGQEQGDNPSLDIETMADRMTTLASGALSAIRDLTQQRRSLDKEIDRVQRALSSLGEGQSASTEVTISYASPNSTSATAVLTYQTRSAGWTPVYEASLDSDEQALTLRYQAEVRQETGADWSGVEMRLSTARVSAGGQLPDPGSYIVDLYEPRPDSAREGQAADLKMASPEAMSGVRQARLEQDGLTRSWRIDGGVDLASDGRSRQLTISESMLETEVTLQTVPEIRSSAFIHARARYQGEAVLPAGTVNLIQDGVYTGRARLSAVRPGEPLELAFGEAQQVSVEKRIADESRGTKGLLGGDAWVRRQLLFELTNNHERPVTLRVLGRMPVARHDDISVEPLEVTKPTERNVEDKAGLLAWDLTLEAGESRTLKLGYEITYPKERELRW